MLILSAALMLGAWVVGLWQRSGDPASWQNDWYCFYETGKRFLEGGSVYGVECTEGRLWLYPPYMLYPYAALSLVSSQYAYLLIAIAVAGATGCAMYLLARAIPGTGVTHVVTPAVFASAPFVATVVMGQHAALLLLGIAGGLWGARTHRPFIGGLFYGLLGIKPNWALVFLAWLILTRRWRSVAGMALVGGLMILSTMPLGPHIWLDYWRAGPGGVADLLDPNAGTLAYPATKLITFEALVRSTLGRLSQNLADIAWLGLMLAGVLAAALVWWRASDVDDQLPITVLIAIAVNPYVEFYDALVLAVPAALWWTGRHRYRRVVWRRIGWVVVGLWFYYWVWSLTLPILEWPALVGAFLALWIVAEAWRFAGPLDAKLE